MLTCPDCRIDLTRERTPLGAFWLCPSCHGRAALIPILRKTLTHDTVNALWQGAQSPHAPRRRHCPACATAMSEVQLPANLSAQAIDVCTRCQCVWFDPREYENTPALPPQPPSFSQALPPEAREKWALPQIQNIQERHHRDALPETWQTLPALFGLPVEYGNHALSAVPWITRGLAAVIAAVSLVTLFIGPSEIFLQYGLIPAECLRYGGLTLLTSTFLHGDLFHLLSNLYFFLVFGDDVEAETGPGCFILLLLLSELASNLTHILCHSGSTVPCIGASGMISGVLAYYALAFPHVHLGWFIRIIVIFRWISLPARTFLLFWIGLQLFEAINQAAGGQVTVSVAAHLGGAATGALFWLIKNKKKRPPSHEEPNGYNKAY